MAKDNRQQQQQQQNQEKSKNKGGGNRNFITYNFQVAKRYFGTILQEAFLGAVFVSPFYAFFYFSGIHSVTIPTNFIVLWALATFVFILQSSMFRKGG